MDFEDLFSILTKARQPDFLDIKSHLYCDLYLCDLYILKLEQGLAPESLLRNNLDFILARGVSFLVHHRRWTEGGGKASRVPTNRQKNVEEIEHEDMED